MNNYICGDYFRISKTEARKRYERGEKVYFTPVNLRPDALKIWGECCPPWDAKNRFDDLVAAFTFYNCNEYAGRYPAFYVKGGNK
jgi:hypothetical protein